jgi:predicted acetyltransferase
MAYAVAELEPDALVDVATLTGAIKMALGQRTGGLFANDDRLAELLRTASLAAGEPLWRMPLVADYEERISSKIADADNAGGAPGAITAALFLQHFAGGLPWAHLDIASVGDSPVDEHEYTLGATGFGARALLHWRTPGPPAAPAARWRRRPTMTLRLIEPDPSYQSSYVAALRELTREGNAHYLELVLPAEPRLPGATYTLARLTDPATFAEFCDFTRSLEQPGTPRPAGWVTGTYRWMVADGEVVGRASLRHTLTPWLLEVGGHIGYAVRPSARRRGHATEALRLMLGVAAKRGLDPVLVTCDDDNVGSRRVIEANGGVLEDIRNHKMRFWLSTS